MAGENRARVVLDGMDYGRIDALQSLDANDIEEILYLSSSEATTRFGTGYPGGVILVSTR